MLYSLLVIAWSHYGATSIENCQMLCKTHNRAKGNNRVIKSVICRIILFQPL